MIEFYFDFKCPASYLALGPTQALARETGTKIDWQPFKTRPIEMPEEKPSETRGETHRRVRAIQRRKTHLKYAGLRGLAMQFRDPERPTDAALAALLGATGEPMPYIEAAFAAYWTTDADLDDPDTVARLVSETGLGVAPMDRDEITETLAAHQARLEEDGIFTTPLYRVEDQLFLGREHLPWIREMLVEGD